MSRQATAGEQLQHGVAMTVSGRQSLNLERLRYFVAVAEELHFGRAAARLGISQPPLTKHIQALEAQFGTTLLARNKRSVALTPAGVVLLGEARRLIAHAARVGYVMQGASSGEFINLFLGCVPFALFDVLPSILIRFRAASAGTNVVISEAHTGQVVQDVQAGRLDFGVVWKNFGATELAEHALVTGGFVAALPFDHRLLEAERIELADLASEPLILPSRVQSPYHHDQLIASFVAAGVTPRVEYQVPMILSQLGYVASGLGIAIVPEIARRVPNLRVSFRPIADLTNECRLSLIWSPERMFEVGRRFVEIARQPLESDA